MIRYHWREFKREVWYSVTNPRRKEWYELRYAVSSLWSDIKYPFKQPFWFLATVWAYRDILWHDRDWDHSYLLRMMERKLRRMSEHIGEHGHHVNSEREVRQLLVASELCRRIRMDEYGDYDQAKLDARYGKLKMSFKPPTADSPRTSEMVITRPRIAGREKEERAAMARTWKHAEQQRKADIQFLGHLLDRHLLGWWD